MNMKDNINSFNDYIKLLKKYNHKYPAEELWFRGQRDFRWKLEPNLYRDKVSDVEEGKICLLRYKMPDFLTEFDQFIKNVKSNKLFNIEKLNRFQIMFLGQHYGLLTPVLDWTTDPLAAMFFAMDNYTYNTNIYPVIYIMSPAFCNSNSDKVWSDKSRINEPICIDGEDMDCCFGEWIRTLEEASYIPTALCSKQEFSYRISRQSGNFTLHSPIQPLNFEWNNTLISGRQLVEKLTINPDATKEIKLCLECLNINKSTVYKIDNDKLDNESVKIKNETIKRFQNDLINYK